MFRVGQKTQARGSGWGVKINAEGLALIKEFEGCKLRAYKDVVGVWTIGWGHTGAEVREGLVLTQEEADRALQADLGVFERAVGRATDVCVSPNQFSAMVCLTYNIGAKAFTFSTLLDLVNQGKFAEAAAQFKRWNKAGGKVVAGLTRRRAAEAALFLKA